MRLCGPEQAASSPAHTGAEPSSAAGPAAGSVSDYGAASDAEQGEDVLLQLPLPAPGPRPHLRRLVWACELSEGSHLLTVSRRAVSAPIQAGAPAAGPAPAGSSGRAWSMSSVLLPSAAAPPLVDREAGAFLLSGRAAAPAQQQQAQASDTSQAPARLLQLSQCRG